MAFDHPIPVLGFDCSSGDNSANSMAIVSGHVLSIDSNEGVACMWAWVYFRMNELLFGCRSPAESVFKLCLEQGYLERVRTVDTNPIAVVLSQSIEIRNAAAVRGSFAIDYHASWVGLVCKYFSNIHDS